MALTRALFLVPSVAALLGAACNSPSDAPPSAPSAAPTSGEAAGALSAAAPAKPPPSDLGIVAEAPDGFSLYPLKGGAFVDAAGFLAALGDGPLKQLPSAMKGLEKGTSGAIAGSWPDGTWILADTPYKWIKDRWAEQQILREGETLLAVTAWGDNRAVAAIAMPNNDMRFFLVGGKSGVVMPAPSSPPHASDTTMPASATSASPAAKTPAALASASAAPAAVAPAASASASAAPNASAIAPGASVAAPSLPAVPLPTVPADDEAAKPDENACKVRMKPEAVKLSGLPTGEFFAAGYECQPQGHGAAIVEHWDAKKVHGTVDSLPMVHGDSGVDVRGVLALAPADAYAYGNVDAKPYLAHFDGKTWVLEAVTFAGAVTSLAVADDGALFAVAGGLYKKPAGGAWSEVGLPPLHGDALIAQAVWPRTAKDLWVTAATAKGEGALLRSGSTSPAMKLPSRKTMTDMVSSNRRFFATEACDKIFAHLATIGPSLGPVPSDFPAIKDAFGGQKEFETVKFIVEDDGANLYIGAQAPTLELAQKVLARYKEKNPKAATNVFCHEPILIKKAIVLASAP